MVKDEEKIVSEAASGQTFQRLLNELHGKRQWLDGMIESLEAALDSPERKLIEETAKALADNPNVPLVDLPADRQDKLSRLARDVRTGTRRSDQ